MASPASAATRAPPSDWWPSPARAAASALLQRAPHGGSRRPPHRPRPAAAGPSVSGCSPCRSGSAPSCCTPSAPRSSKRGAGAAAQLGAVSFLHRFGSALNPHFHFHVVVLDGLFFEDDAGTVTFHEATHLASEDVHRLQHTLQRRVPRLYRRHGLLDDQTVADMLTPADQRRFSLDASVRIHGSDTAGRERLLRYCARPPPSSTCASSATATRAPPTDRQARPPSARSATTRRGATPGGRTVLVLSPDFLAALSRLIPPPRVHRHRYHGVLAPNARLREHVVALDRHGGEGPVDTPPPARGATASPTSSALRRSSVPPAGRAATDCCPLTLGAHRRLQVMVCPRARPSINARTWERSV
jgi:hypothetical protein